MNKVNNTPIEGFEKALDQIPSGILSEVKNRIAVKCGWTTRSTFHNKMKGSTRIFKLEAEALEVIFKQYGIDVRTGEPIKETAKA